MLSLLEPTSSRRMLNRLVQSAEETALRLHSISDAELLNRSTELRAKLATTKKRSRFSLGNSMSLRDGLSPKNWSAKGWTNGLSSELGEPLALASLSIERHFGFRPFSEQLLAAAAVAQGRIIDMKTGEGKSVVAVMATYLCAAQGCRVNLATTNAYLAQRDAENAQGFFDRLGISVGTVLTNHQPSVNRHAYQCDVAMGPGYQYGFDFLKDQSELRKSNQCGLGWTILNELHGQAGDQLIQPSQLDVAIIDEADSVLIDEATTPLILSGAPNEEPDERPFNVARDVTASFVEDREYKLNKRKIELTELGHERVKTSFAAVESLRLERPWSIYLENALTARLLYRRDEHYVVSDKKVKIVDYQTGRIFDDRSWQNGLHQAVEALESLPITPSREIMARVTRQRFFQRYKQVAGLSGTLNNLDQELYQVYKARTFAIPTHRPCQRFNLTTRFFVDWQAKLDAIAVEVAGLHQVGRPILIGTRTISASREVAARLQQAGLEPIILNGMQDQDEAEIIAEAGQVGSIMVATNMAGRGTDIKLSAAAREVGGLHVIGTEAHDSTRVDHQLIGRAGRQGDPGSSQFFISMEDHLLKESDSRLAKKLTNPADYRSDRTGEINQDLSAAIRQLQQRIELQQRIAREDLQSHDHWLDSIRENFEKIA